MNIFKSPVHFFIKFNESEAIARQLTTLIALVSQKIKKLKKQFLNFFKAQCTINHHEAITKILKTVFIMR